MENINYHITVPVDDEELLQSLAERLGWDIEALPSIPPSTSIDETEETEVLANPDEDTCDNEYDEDENEEPRQVVVRIIRPMSELKQVQEEEAAKQKELAKPKMCIRVIGGKSFTGSYGSAFVQMIQYFGWERVRDLNFEVRRGPLIAPEKKSNWWHPVAPGWFVNCNMRPNQMKTMAYSIAKAVNHQISVSWT